MGKLNDNDKFLDAVDPLRTGILSDSLKKGIKDGLRKQLLANRKAKKMTDLKVTSPATACCKHSQSPEDEVRELAYFKWEAAGKPVSDGTEFWVAAEEEIFGFNEGLLDLEQSRA